MLVWFKKSDREHHIMNDSATSEVSVIDLVPTELWFKIFKFLKTEKDLSSCFFTCTRWKNILSHIPILHKRLCKYKTKLLSKFQFWLLQSLLIDFFFSSWLSPDNWRKMYVLESQEHRIYKMYLLYQDQFMEMPWY